MMSVFKYVKGDKALWVIIVLLAIASFLPVYSASTNLAYAAGSKITTFGFFMKHIVLLLVGFFIIWVVHKIPYKYFSGSYIFTIPIVVILLIATLMQGTTYGGANASRWLHIPFIGIGFQTSTLANIVIMMYVARFLSKNKGKQISFKEGFIKLWIPVGLILILILPANFSTTAIIFAMVWLLAFIGGYSIKHLFYILGIGLVGLALFILIAKAFPEAMPNRINTWGNRIEGFFNPGDTEKYQVEKAKIAIASGVGIIGVGPGKSVLKSFLPQSSSDFIFAIIIEEFGLLGGGTILFLYFMLLLRIVNIARKANTVFATLLVIGMGIPIIFQALINMGVAVNLLPVTGQTLPLISSGGTSIWMTCIAFGVILSVSASRDETEKTILDDNPLDIIQETSEENIETK